MIGIVDPLRFVIDLFVIALLAGIPAALLTRLLLIPTNLTMFTGPFGIIDKLRIFLRALDPNELYPTSRFFGSLMSCQWCLATWCGPIVLLFIFIPLLVYAADVPVQVMLLCMFIPAGGTTATVSVFLVNYWLNEEEQQLYRLPRLAAETADQAARASEVAATQAAAEAVLSTE